MSPSDDVLSLAVLRDCCQRFTGNSELRAILEEIEIIDHNLTPAQQADIGIPLYEQAIDRIETEIFNSDITDQLVELYQSAFRELESWHAGKPKDDRHQFVVVIPVADRPRHLQSCLDSLLLLCQKFSYGGNTGSGFSKITVIIADDSKQPDNIERHQQLATEFNQQGLAIDYFGLQQQLDLFNQLDKIQKAQLAGMLGDKPASAFYHKGPSIMRNLCYLKLDRMRRQQPDCLYYFIDSDQEFCIRLVNAGQEKDLYLINYFYQLDSLFRTRDISVLTGKVVGDPPVSPAVMAGNFLDDISDFLQQLSGLEAASDCSFHAEINNSSDDAAYHDMANLFGFNRTAQAHQFHCRLSGPHDHAACLHDFAARLSHFFFGEHSTRTTWHQHQDINASVKAARTVYTGNYVFNASGLDYFIPFAGLRLRMAGPVLGRLLKAAIGPQFVSANLPMLHKRTVGDSGQSEFRPGIEQQHRNIDLSGEFERQFFGDVMLFSIERLTALGYPADSLPEKQVMQTVEQVHQKIHTEYVSKHNEIVARLHKLQAEFNNPQHWWNRTPASNPARQLFGEFFANIEYNFADDSSGYQLINSPQHVQQRLQQIAGAILAYPDDCRRWTDLLYRRSSAA